MPPDYVPSFTTTCLAFVENGVAKLTRCCLDSGFESIGSKSCINPTIVEKLGLRPHRIEGRIGLADGSRSMIRWEVQASLSFQVPSGLLTIPIVFEVRPKDSPSDSMILSTGVLHVLGGVHDHRTNPTTFQVTVAGELVELQSETPDAQLEFHWIPKKEQPMEYLTEVISSPAFLKRDQRDCLPSVALRNFNSKDIRELMAVEAGCLTDAVKLKMSRWAKEVEITEGYQKILDTPDAVKPEEKIQKMQEMLSLIHSGTPSLLWPNGEWQRKQREAQRFGSSRNRILRKTSRRLDLFARDGTDAC